MRAPLAGLVYTLSGLLTKLVRAVDAVREQKEARGESAGPATQSAGPEAAHAAEEVAEEPAASVGEDSATE
jgi:hypothetical protein